MSPRGPENGPAHLVRFFGGVKTVARPHRLVCWTVWVSGGWGVTPGEVLKPIYGSGYVFSSGYFGTVGGDFGSNFGSKGHFGDLAAP